MASIFLSYSREDAAKAKALAKCLERAGHNVWWDRNIHGGTEYADEIEAALGEAQVVLHGQPREDPPALRRLAEAERAGDLAGDLG